MARLTGRAVVALIVVAPVVAGIPSTPAAAAGGDQWERIDAPPAGYVSAYQAVETAPDGSIYVAGWQRHHDAGLGDVFETIVRKFDAAGEAVWTELVGGLWPTAPEVPDLVVDGVGNPYLRLCRSSCSLTAFNPANGDVVDAIGDDGLQNSSPPIGVRSGGVLAVSRTSGPTTLAARRLTPALDTSWSFALTGKLDADANTWLVETSSGSFWAIGHEPGSQAATVMANFSATGSAIGDPIEHAGGSPFDEAWIGRRSSPVSYGPGDTIWIGIDPPGTDLFDQHTEAFSLTTGGRLGNVETTLPHEQVPYESGYAQCDDPDTDVLFGGLLTGTNVLPRFEARVLGSLSATVMRCTPLNGGAPVSIMIVHEASSPLGGALARVGHAPFPVDTTVSDIALATSGRLVFAGSTVAASPDAWFLLPPGPTAGPTSAPRAALALDPTGTPGDFNALTPVRLFDTRSSEPDGLVVVPKTRLTPGSDLKVRVAGFGGVPAHGAGAISINLTVTNPVSPGFVTAYPCGSVPLASNLNFFGGQTVANAVIAPLSAQGEVCLHASTDTDLLADVNGWLPSGGGFQALTPVRVFDSRPGEPDGAVAIAKQRYGGGNIVQVRVGNVPGVPADASAVSLNVTVTEPADNGFVTVYPCGDRPLSSNVNFTAGQTVPNAVIAPLGTDSMLCFFASADTHLIADLNGYFSSTTTFEALAPTRVFDTRVSEPDGAVPVTKQQYGGDKLLTVRIAGAAGVPAAGVGAVSLNVTVTNPTAAGFVTVYPCGPRPLASSVNYMAAGATVPNAVLTPVSPSGDVCFYAHADTDLIADINGWFPA